MSSHWNGKELQTIYTSDAGYDDDGSLIRTLRYLNEIQRDIASSGEWPNLKFLLKKKIREDKQYVDLSPQIPEASTLQLRTGGTLPENRIFKTKVTFVIFDNEIQEYSSIESQPSPASAGITTTSDSLSIQVSNIPSYEGDSDILPNKIHRRVYLSESGGPFYLAKTIEDNDSNTVLIDAPVSSTIEPPEHSMVECLASEDLQVKVGSRILSEETVDNIQKYDPGMTSKGLPKWYARISETKIMLYPRPSTDMTLSYWVKRRPSRIFADSEREIQLNRSLEGVLEAGVQYKWTKYKQDAEWNTFYQLYEDLKSKAKAEKISKGGQFSKVKVVC